VIRLSGWRVRIVSNANPRDNQQTLLT
jgi:NAD(P)-dependent dehydrogenase (short-subunit alcohol dehydrogenase family)